MTNKRAIFAKELVQKIDKTGTVLQKTSNPFSAQLEMELVVGKTRAILRASQSPYGNGSTNVVVKKGNRILFEAQGDMWLQMEISKDTDPGTWEKEFGL